MALKGTLLALTALAYGMITPSFACNDSDPWAREETILGQARRVATLNKTEEAELVKFLASFTSDPDPFVRAKAFHALFQWKESIEVRELARLASTDISWVVRREVFNLLGQDYDRILLSLTDEDPQIRVMAVTALRRFAGRSEVFGVLLERLGDPHRQVIVETIGGFKVLGRKEVIPYLFTLQKAAPWVKSEVKDTIKHLSGMSSEEAILAFGEKDLPIGIGSAPVNRYDSVMLMERLARSSSSPVRVTLAAELAWTGDICALMTILDDSDPRVRYAAAYSLKQDLYLRYKEHPEILKQIRTHLSDSHPQVQALLSNLEEALLTVSQ